ncbi:hypothetical protein AMJ47_00595 [Parcubacteria bacterium DG_72]|nr:MAG: hypothetical protein AMJ47_00595 [Parcubacteria bacterium DG_72]
MSEEKDLFQIKSCGGRKEADEIKKLLEQNDISAEVKEREKDFVVLVPNSEDIVNEALVIITSQEVYDEFYAGE